MMNNKSFSVNLDANILYRLCNEINGDRLMLHISVCLAKLDGILEYWLLDWVELSLFPEP